MYLEKSKRIDVNENRIPSSRRAELTDAISYYNIQSEGLGYKFAAEVKRALERIVQYPDAWFRLSKRTRRCRTNRFPYGVIYQIRKESRKHGNRAQSQRAVNCGITTAST